jgi:hypothetical protein
MQVGAYLGALLVGTTAMRLLQDVVGRLFGVVTGPVAVAYTLASIAVFVLVTAWAFSVFAVPYPRRRRSNAPG